MITNQEIEELHKKYAQSTDAFQIVFTHCQIVTKIAGKIIEKKMLQINTNLVHKGALLHDIGAYKFIDKNGIFDESNYLLHGVEGYKLLVREHLPEAFCLIAKRHTGVGLTEEDIIRQHLPLPLENYTAQTVEEKLIMYADKFHSKTPKFNTYHTIRKNIQMFGKDKREKLQELNGIFGTPELGQLAKIYQQPLV